MVSRPVGYGWGCRSCPFQSDYLVFLCSQGLG